MPIFNPPNYDPQLIDFNLRLTEIESNYAALVSALAANQTATAAAQSTADDAAADIATLQADIATLQTELGNLITPIAIASFNGVSGSVGWRQKVDPQGLIGALTRTGAGQCTIAITGLTENAIVTTGTAGASCNLECAANLLTFRSRNSSGTLNDYNWNSFTVWAL